MGGGGLPFPGPAGAGGPEGLRPVGGRAQGWVEAGLDLAAGNDRVGWTKRDRPAELHQEVEGGETVWQTTILEDEGSSAASVE